MRVMLDTNVIISDLIFGSPTIVAVEQDVASNHEMLLCTYVIDEARTVISRKWPERMAALERLLQDAHYEVIVTPRNPVSGLFDIRDPKDYPVLYSAMLGDADVLVTGDKDFAASSWTAPRSSRPPNTPPSMCAAEGRRRRTRCRASP